MSSGEKTDKQFSGIKMIQKNINYILKCYLTVKVIGLRWFFDMVSEL
jgi:hypothetical protein